MPPPRGRRGANCAMTRRGGRGARWSGRGGDKGHAARVNKAYLFLRYCDSAWTPSKSTLCWLRRPGREREWQWQWQWHCSPRVRRALEPSRAPAHAFVASAFALCVAVLDAACFAFAFVCRLFIEPTSQPGKASEQQQVPGLRSPHPAWAEVRAHTPCPATMAFRFCFQLRSIRSAFEHHQPAVRFRSRLLAFCKRRDDPCPLESRHLFRLTSDHEWLLASEPWTVTGIAGNVRHHNYKVRDHTAVALTSYAG
uniref:Uncharacterized protein n=1 Tax=Saccharum officinarum TaxID=4547 RepID=A0A678TGW8_SACOF|nr:hypothetical protein SO77L24_000010 [Saccharum officinarum]